MYCWTLFEPDGGVGFFHLLVLLVRPEIKMFVRHSIVLQEREFDISALYTRILLCNLRLSVAR
jgi:hypothetical protein